MALVISCGFTTAGTAATFPDEVQLREIINLGLSSRHVEALKVAQVYTAKNKHHACGHFVTGLVNEWRIEPLDPEPPLTPAIEAFEAAGEATAGGSGDIGAGICRGAALVRLSRIYFKYGQYFSAVRRAVTGGKELERIKKIAPEAYDLYTFLGPYHYFAENTPAPVRAFLRVFGLKGDKALGLEELQTAWEKAPLFRDEAGQILFVLQSKYEGNVGKYDAILEDLLDRYPQNLIYQRMHLEAARGTATASHP